MQKEKELQILQKRVEQLEEQIREEEEKKKQKETIEYNLGVIQASATKMMKVAEEGYGKRYCPYKHVCKEYAEGFEAIYNSIRILDKNYTELMNCQFK